MIPERIHVRRQRDEVADPQDKLVVSSGLMFVVGDTPPTGSLSLWGRVQHLGYREQNLGNEPWGLMGTMGATGPGVIVYGEGAEHAYYYTGMGAPRTVENPIFVNNVVMVGFGSLQRRVDRVAKTIADRLSVMKIMRQVLLDEEDTGTIWVVVSAPRFDVDAVDPVYQTAVEALAGVNPPTPDFRVVNIQELSERRPLSRVIPETARTLWKR